MVYLHWCYENIVVVRDLIHDLIDSMSTCLRLVLWEYGRSSWFNTWFYWARVLFSIGVTQIWPNFLLTIFNIYSIIPCSSFISVTELWSRFILTFRTFRTFRTLHYVVIYTQPKGVNHVQEHKKLKQWWCGSKFHEMLVSHSLLCPVVYVIVSSFVCAILL